MLFFNHGSHTYWCYQIITIFMIPNLRNIFENDVKQLQREGNV